MARLCQPGSVNDLAALAVTFGSELRDAGVPTTIERSGRFVRAVDLVKPLAITELYWTARITLVTDQTDLDSFDRVFGQVFRGHIDVADHRGDQASPPLVQSRPAATPATRPRHASINSQGASATAHSSRTEGSEDIEEREVTVGAASRQERLASTDFAELDENELAELYRLMQQLRVTPPLRQGRRTRRHRHRGRLDLRATLRRSRHSGGDPVAQIMRRRRARPRRLVVLCDISGSMEPYARAYVQFLHAAAGGLRAEVFTFATRLTRLTRSVSVADPQLAVSLAAAAGEAIKTFLDQYGRRGMARGAVVVIVSDGWERDDPALLSEQMARLGRLAHRVIWVNPRSADPRFRPLAGGMAAALPHCDAVVSGHTTTALRELIATIADGD
jgi:uncharacterized protein with von Willebrand factor type A (vWA) domain